MNISNWSGQIIAEMRVAIGKDEHGAQAEIAIALFSAEFQVAQVIGLRRGGKIIHEPVKHVGIADDGIAFSARAASNVS